MFKKRKCPESETYGGNLKVQVGGRHACVINLADSYECWGNNEYGQTDLNLQYYSHHPINYLPDKVNAKFDLSLGWDFSCFLSAIMNLECVGFNYLGQTDIPGDLRENVSIYNIDLFDSGLSHSCALYLLPKSKSKVVCWGGNDEFGQLDAGNHISILETPVLLTVGHEFTCIVLKADNNVSVVRCLGNNDHGQIETPDLNAGMVFQVVAGAAHSCLVRDNMVGNRILCWGSDSHGQLGVPHSFKYGNCNTISAGDVHTCGVDHRYQVVCWGMVPFTVNDMKVIQVVSEYENYCVREYESELTFCFGGNEWGQCEVPIFGDVY